LRRGLALQSSIIRSIPVSNGTILIARELRDLQIHGLLAMATSNAFLRHVRIRPVHFRRFASGVAASTCASRRSAFANNPDRYGYAITGNYWQNCFIAELLAKASVLISFVRSAALRPDSKKQIV
jgi:hypothetical protein